MTGAAVCTNCPAGQVTATEGASALSACGCPPGSYLGLRSYRQDRAVAGEIKAGSRVTLTDQHAQFGDAASGPLKIGDTGAVISVKERSRNSSSSESVTSSASRPLTDASLIVLCGAVSEICKTTHTDLAAGRFTRPLFAVMLFSYFQLGSPSAEELEVHRGVGNRLGELKSSKGAERQWDLHQRRGETR